METIRLIAHLLQIEEQGAHGSEHPILGIEENAPVILIVPTLCVGM
jgi:hypothetical protein